MHEFTKFFVPGRTGYRIAYHANEANHCPGCGRTHWLIGRITAECAFCATAIPLNDGGVRGVGLIRTNLPRPAPLAA